jgi:hypothetical protein
VRGDGLKGIRNLNDDLFRLNALRSPEASYRGLLLLAFDYERNKLTDELLAANIPKELHRWFAAHRSWPDAFASRAFLGFCDRCWFWYYPTATEDIFRHKDLDNSLESGPAG